VFGETRLDVKRILALAAAAAVCSRRVGSGGVRTG
jgi:hypothetical protein